MKITTFGTGYVGLASGACLAEVDTVAKLKELMADDKLAAALSQHARQRLSVPGGHKFAQAVAELLA